ncbi:TIGR02117 family protein [Loktanella sp. IMCC34160]|uniref:TIGR02117 family protein n=1 Tax=Loktanella sp. IMCC34160 TaxID=2510646 RepID=UPI0013ED983A|nr:TIGR02117 family protein [Loktanella sp. IMCC34160]
MIRSIRFSGLLLACVVAAYLFSAVIGALLSGAFAAGDDPVDREVLLVAGPIHFDFLLPLDDPQVAAFSFAAEAGVPMDDPRARWLVVGWGSAAFYTTVGSYADVAPVAVWRAVTGDQAVMRFDVAGEVPDVPGVHRLSLSEGQFSALIQAIRADLGDVPDPLPLDGFNETDAFFAARGHFSIFRTCNVWVGEKLRQAGVAFGRWTPTPYSVRLSLWWHRG